MSERRSATTPASLRPPKAKWILSKIYYHGASSTTRRSIRKHGLRNYSWITDSQTEARVYAHIKAKQRRGSPDIWAIRLSAKQIQEMTWEFKGLPTFWKFYRRPKGIPISLLKEIRPK